MARYGPGFETQTRRAKYGMIFNKLKDHWQPVLSAPVHENSVHRSLLTSNELHRPQVHSFPQACHQGDVSQRPKRHHLAVGKKHMQN